MSRDKMDPELIRFMTAHQEKYIRDRLKWNNTHAETIKKATTLHRKEKGHTPYDVSKATMLAEMPAIGRDHVIESTNRRRIPIRDGTQIAGVAQLRKGHSIVDLNLGDPKEDLRLTRPDTDTSLDPLMRVMDPSQRDILYKNLPNFGKVAYLKSRSRMIPEDKYYFPECSSWEYGWRMKDSQNSKNRPSYGRDWRYVRDSISRTGAQPDPAYYTEPDINTFLKCSR
nr:uncharacterized protein LOC128676023 [Plodia interpunctella]